MLTLFSCCRNDCNCCQQQRMTKESHRGRVGPRCTIKQVVTTGYSAYLYAFNGGCNTRMGKRSGCGVSVTQHITDWFAFITGEEQKLVTGPAGKRKSIILLWILPLFMSRSISSYLLSPLASNWQMTLSCTQLQQLSLLHGSVMHQQQAHSDIAYSLLITMHAYKSFSLFLTKPSIGKWTCSRISHKTKILDIDIVHLQFRSDKLD